MKILGIDTSCDDTCISIIKSEIRSTKSETDFEILSNVISSQVKLHAKYGGVYPMLAKREHIKNLPLVFRKATKNIKVSEIGLIGVTVGPGLEPCLWQGINFAKKLAKKLKKPLIPVNHLEAHILASCLTWNVKQLEFPAVCLVVSGGHTQLILMKGIGKYRLIGETRDDAAGECFDKVARILGLGYPGGPAIAAEAAKYKIQNTRYKIQLPRPMIHQKNYDFSFSGLKTAVLYKVRELKTINYKLKTELCAEVQQAITDVLIKKTIKAAKDYRAKSIILGGGVAANDELKKQFNWKLEIENCKFNFWVPPQNLCTDNAAMVGTTAFFHQPKSLKNIKAEANLKI